MKVFLQLLRREYWENRGGFMITPVTIGVIMIAGLVLALFTVVFFSKRLNGEEFIYTNFIQQLGEYSREEIAAFYTAGMHTAASIFLLVLAFVLFFYCLGALYDDRKDRSILFWRSLPVSDFQTVMSKLATAMVIAPLITLAAVAATHLVFALIALIVFASGGVNVWDKLIAPLPLFSVWLSLLGTMFVHALWAAPLYGWCLLASAFARSRPFLWAVVPPVMLGFMQSWFNLLQTFDFRSNQIFEIIGERLVFFLMPQALGMEMEWKSDFEPTEVTNVNEFFAGLLTRLGDPSLIYGIPFAILCIAAAIYIRRYRDDA